PAAAHLRADEEVLQVDAVPAGPGGEVDEPQGEPDRLAGVLGDVREDRRVLAEQGLRQVLLGGLHRVRLALVDGQVADEPQDGGDVVRACGADHGAPRRVGAVGPTLSTGYDAAPARGRPLRGGPGAARLEAGREGRPGAGLRAPWRGRPGSARTWGRRAPGGGRRTPPPRRRP